MLELAIELFTTLSLLSVATVRVVELFKVYLHTFHSIPAQAYMAMAMAVGTAISWMSGGIPVMTGPGEHLLVGLLVSGGSGFWHDLLSIVRGLAAGGTQK